MIDTDERKWSNGKRTTHHKQIKLLG